MRYGSYSEDSDESDSHGHKGSDRTSTKTRKEHSIPEVSLKQELEDAVQSNSETSFYSYHSDDENENIERMLLSQFSSLLIKLEDCKCSPVKPAKSR
jgi:hypothetical protein